MKPFYLTAIAGCAFVLLSCSMFGGSGSPPLRRLAKGFVSGINEPKEEVIKDKATWEKLWASHIAGSAPAPKLPEVDFQKEMVIAVIMGQQRTGGYAIEVVNVESSSDRLRISIRKIRPRPDAITAQVISTPFDFVAVPKSNLQPEFVESSQSPKTR